MRWGKTSLDNYRREVKGMRRLVVSSLVVCLLILVLSIGSFAATIQNSKHDLSTGSTGPNKSDQEDQICIFCHTPHNAIVAVPLWNRTNPGGTGFTLYSNPDTIDGTITTDLTNTVSLMCLSCHDGTTALSSYANAKGIVTGTGVTADVITSAAALGTDLSNDHPINITYSADDPELEPAANLELKGVQLFENKVQCASCHAVHGKEGVEKFLRVSNAGSGLCLACHTK